MKKLYILAFICSITISVRAGSGELFTYDEVLVDEEMAQLQSLEDFLLSNPAATLNEIESAGIFDLKGMKLFPDNSFRAGSFLSEPPLGIPSFLWGCVFGVVGLLIVYLVSEDEVETKKALKGCVIAYLVEIGCIVVYYVVIVGTFGSLYYYY